MSDEVCGYCGKANGWHSFHCPRVYLDSVRFSHQQAEQNAAVTALHGAIEALLDDADGKSMARLKTLPEVE